MANKRHRAAAAAVVLFAANAFVCFELFRTEFTAQMGSIEAAYVSLTRYITQNWTDLTWFPLWYNGIPYQNTYPPLLHLATAVFAAVTGATPALSYHGLTALLYCLGPVTLFWLAYRLSGSLATSFTAGLCYSLFSPSIVLVPAIRADVNTVFFPRRFQALVEFGEGPHIAAMTLLPLAVLALDTALARRKPAWHVLAALALASVVLTNWLGGAALAAAVLSLLLDRFGRDVKSWATAVCIGALAYVLASPWIPPSTLAAVRTNAQRIGGPYSMTSQHLRYAGLLIAMLVALDWLLDRFKASQVIRFAATFTLLMGTVTLSAAWLHVPILPQPDRYHLEMEMGLALLGVFATAPWVSGLSRGRKAMLTAAVALFCISQAKTYRGYAKYLSRPVEIRSTVEYAAAEWFDQHASGQRVLGAGSISFWMNAFTDTPQFGGGFDQGITNPLIPVMLYQVYSGEGAREREGEIGELWVRAFGIGAVFVPGLNGRAFFKDYRNPQKFQGRFREVWRSGDDAIWEVPRRSTSLAHVMAPNDLASRMPTGGLDVDPLRPYVAALENPALPLARMRWTGRHSAGIEAQMHRAQVLSVQISYHPGLRATANGRPCPTHRDNLGLLVVEPSCEGACTVELTYNGGPEMIAAKWLSWSALFGALAWVVVDWRKHNARAAKLATSKL